MKICHLTCVHQWDDTRIFYKMALSIVKGGYDFVLIAPGESHIEQGVKIIGIGKKPKSRLKRMTSYARKCYKVALAQKADIYHVHDPELLPYAVKLKQQGYKVIFDSHENILQSMIEKSYIPKYLRNIIVNVFTWYAKNTLHKMNVLITVTPAIVDLLKQYNKNTWMVTNYPLLKEMPKDDQRIPGKICFTGGVNEDWKIHNIIEAVNQIDGSSFYVCGPSSDSYIEKLKNTPGWDKTKYLGKISKKDVAALQSSSSIGVAYTKYRPNIFGKLGSLGITKTYEYMMMGLPVVCTDLVCWKEMIDKYHCGIYVSPDDQEGLKKAITYLIENPDKAREMGRNGRQAVEKEYSWPSQEKILFELYNSLK